MRAAVEVVATPFGRTTTFALACNAKYYEDAGYPGPVETARTNFQPAARLARVRGPVLPAGPGAEFLLTTYVLREANQLHFDEQWSRAGGDYVLSAAP